MPGAKLTGNARLLTPLGSIPRDWDSVGPAETAVVPWSPAQPTRNLDGRVVHNNQPAVAQCSDGVATIGGHNGNHAWLQNLRCSVDGHFQFTLNDFVNFFFGMEVLVY
jgi:hypothetical protein